MTKEITKAMILQEMQDKLALREFAPSPFLFDETVIPVYNIENHLGKWEVMSSSVTVTSATNFLAFAVPQNEKWTIRAYQMTFYNVGAYQISGAYIDNRPGPSNYIYLDLKANQATSYLVNLPESVVLVHPNRIRVLVDTYVSDATLGMDIDVKREELR